MYEGQKFRMRRRLQHVPRWAVVPTIKKQTVAEHVYQYGAILMYLKEFVVLPEEDWAHLFEDLWHHDMEESVTGDTPSPSKVKPRLSTLPRISKVSKLADCLEAYVFCIEEMAMGNSLMAPISEEILSKISFIWESLGEYNMGYFTMVSHFTKHVAMIGAKSHPALEHQNDEP